MAARRSPAASRRYAESRSLRVAVVTNPAASVFRTTTVTLRTRLAASSLRAFLVRVIVTAVGAEAAQAARRRRSL